MKCILFLFCLMIALPCSVYAQSVKNPEVEKEIKEEVYRKKLEISGFTITKHKIKSNGEVSEKGDVINISKFNSQGKLIYKKIFFPVVHKKIFSLDVSDTLFNQFSNIKLPSSSFCVEEFEFDVKGKVVKKIISNPYSLGSIMIYEYDEDNNLVKKKTFAKSRKGKSKKLMSFEDYNGENSTSYNKKGETLSTIKSTFNEDGNKYYVIKKYFKDNVEMSKVYVLRNDGLIQQSNEYMKYPLGSQDVIISYQYDLKGNEVKKVYNSRYSLSRELIETKTKYNSKGSICEKTSFNFDTKEEHLLVYEYKFF